MKVGFAQVDGKWPNLALAKLAAWSRSQGDSVEWFNPLIGADVVYASKVFTDTPDDPYLPENTTRGGSGYGLDSEIVLPDWVERLKPDWSLWPAWKKDMGYTTRGCVRRCPFCIVPKKEGPLRVVAEFGDLTTGRGEMTLHDNNITAAPLEHFRKFCEDATTAGVRFDFNQALDARLFNEDHAAVLVRSSHIRTIRFAFDDVAIEPHVRRTVATCVAAGIPAKRLMFFVLVGFNTTPEQDMYRVELLRSLDCDPFVMRYNRHDRYQTRFSRWVNNMAAFNAMSFEEYLKTFRSETPIPDDSLVAVGA